MNKTFTITLFLVGLFAGLALGLLWGVPLGTRDTNDSLRRLEAQHTATQDDITTIKEAVKSSKP